MRFKFSLSHAILGTLEITEPSGWKDAVLKLERDENFHSLIEYFEGSFIFYGNNGIDNGGIDFIKEVEQIGVDETIVVQIDLTLDDINYTPVFTGQFKFSDLEEMMDNKLRLPIIRDDFWSKFISRLDIPVNLKSALNLDGEATSSIDQILLNLPSQKIRYSGNYNWLYSETYRDATNEHGLQLDWDEVIVDDLKKFTLPRATFDIGNIGGIALNLIGNFEAPYDGDYTLNINFPVAQYNGSFWASASSQLNFFVQNVNDPAQTDPFSESDVVFGSDTITFFTYNKTIRLNRGDQLTIYGDRAATSDEYTIFGTVRLSWKTSVALATTVNIVLSGEQTIDGTLTSSTRILVKNQGDTEENGIYVTGAGAWTRATDANTAVELNDAAVFVTGGSLNVNTAWMQNEEVVTLGVDPIVWMFTFDSDERLRPYPAAEVENNLQVTADTTFKDTIGEGFLLHDAIAAISDRITGQINTFYSELLGSFLTSRIYDQEGCAWKYVLLKGLQLRQYTLVEKPFFMSFMQAWKGINPILNLSLGYDTIDGEPVIRIEEKAYQYDDSEGTSVDFSHVRTITRKYDNDRIFNKVSIGYVRWQAEDISGLHDPQSKKTYSNRFQKVGKNLELYSEFMAASTPIEQARRTSKAKSSDYKYDNEVFVIAINPNEIDESPDTSPDLITFNPELDENFNSITDLVNSESKYNLKLTPGRNFLRWQNYLQGCLQSYLGSAFKFASGEGNYDMTSTMNVNGCLNEDFGGNNLDEKGDITVTDDFIHLPHLYEVEIPMEWEEYETIRDNRRKPIGISLTDVDHAPMFIKTLEYKPVKGSATCLLWAKEYLDLSIIPDTTPMQECMPMSDECENALTDELGNILTDELGICITA